MKKLKTIDKLFDFEEARTMYQNFNNFKIGEFNKTSRVHLVHLDSLITEGIDLLRHSVFKTETLVRKDQRTT